MRTSGLVVIIAASIAVFIAATVGCEPPKTRTEQKADAARAVAMAHLRLELLQEISFQRLSSDGPAVRMQTLKTTRTEPLTFDFWICAGEDEKSFCQTPGGRIAFSRFWNLVLHGNAIDADGWAFDTNFEMETGETVRPGKVSGWPFQQHSPLSLKVGESIERRLNGYTESAGDPSVAYTPIARLTLVDVKSYTEKTAKDGRLLVKLPPEMKREIQEDRSNFANGATPAPATTQSAP